MPKLDDFDNLVSSIYEASLAPERWPEVIARVTRSLDGATSMLLSPTAGPDQGGLWESPDYTPEPMQAYAAYYHDKDVWQLAGVGMGRVPTVVTGELLVPEATFRRSEFYNDFLRQQDIFRVISATVVGADDPLMPEARLSVFRPPGAPAFDPLAQRRFDMLAPHLGRALRMQRLLARKANEAAAYVAVLERLKTGVILLDADQRVLYANASASAILGLRDGLWLREGRLIGAAASISGRIARALHAAMIANSTRDVPGATVAIERPSGRKAFSLTALPVDRDERFQHAYRRAVVLAFVGDPEAQLRPDGEALMRRYRLTRAEARLAVALAGGDTLKQASERFGVTVATARIQLKHIFGKTHVHRQAELVRLVLSSANSGGIFVDKAYADADSPRPDALK